MSATSEPGSMLAQPSGGEPASTGKLVRSIRWPHAFWIATGVPALMLFSVGYIASLDGPVSSVVWVVSVLIGLGMAFVYAELAGMFPEKSGGPPVFGAQAWKRYFRPIAPLNIWGYWFAWSPVIAIGGLLMGDYIAKEWIGGQTWSASWGPFTVNIAFALGVAIVAGVMWVNSFGIKESSFLQLVLAICSLIPLALMIIVPIFEGKVHLSNLTPFTIPGAHGWDGFKLFAAGLFVAGWSAYAFETAVVYTAEFRNPQRDAPKAIFASGALCLFFYGLGPFVLYGVVGGSKIRQDPSVAFVPLSKAVFGAGGQVPIVLLLIALLLSVNTAVLGSSRTLYQASKDGWTFRFFMFTSRRRVPVKAMGFDVAVNIFLMLLGNPIYILAASTIGYMVFNSLDLVVAHLLRRDAPGVPRPYRAPRVMIRLGVVLASVNFILLFVGAPSWGWKAVGTGWGITMAGVVFYFYRLYTDRRALRGSGGIGAASPRAAAAAPGAPGELETEAG
jgi:amino acid transporter